MPNPVITAITAGAWTKVATNVTSGFLWILKQPVVYSHTYRVTGDPAPTVLTEGAKMSYPGLPISTPLASPIDVYLWSDVAGVVRVDV